jgi:prepilin-type N-terminal cleavage/methylation domain-containing protein
MGSHAKVRGFTLIELLIALAIFGMVMGVATYGY